ncbi:hypothetical protein ES695_02255 [Candidatus Atribacteria bacterium 1244-E10-H5-B2]|nr:MAG: hypothetical protein ES695_02255 [Candidatus Atribacteria bacterium 1244-E10-H5-B2]
MIINNEKDISITVDKAKNTGWYKASKGEILRIDRLIELYKIIKENAPLKNRVIELGEWYFPRFYLEVTDKSGRYNYPLNHRLVLSYNVRTGTIMDEVIEGRRSDNFHGCTRKGFYKVLKIIKRQLNTDFFIPIKT